MPRPGNRILALAAIVALGSTLLPSCSCDDSDTNAASTSGPGAGGAGGNGTGGGSGGAAPRSTSSGFGPEECESGNFCGEGVCCAVGEECFLGACLEACASQVRCGAAGEVCCEAGDVCLSGACVVPGSDCLDWTDCEEGEFCEPTLGKCLPQPTGDALCEVTPDFDPVDPALEWSWTSSAIHPSFVQVINMPVVIDLEKDGTPDVVIVTSEGYAQTDPAYLRALNGSDGAEKWPASADVYLAANRVQPRGTPAAADIDGDGFPEIVTPKMGGGLIAFEHDGSFKWVSRNADATPWNVALNSATVAIADLEGDGTAEIVVGGAVFEADGTLRFNNGVFAGSHPAANPYGAVSIVADVNGDGSLDIVTGRRAWNADGTLIWDNGLTDGYPAIANLDLDASDTPELVVVSNGSVRVHEAATGMLLATLPMPGTGTGGPPTIANFDDDPYPEIAAANGTRYAVFDYAALPTPTLSVKWEAVTQDGSSNRTGSSIFDFQGDGEAEVAYGDECYFRVYEGATGNVVYQVPMTTATIHEYPVIVDVDGDSNTEIVVVANDRNHTNGTLSCPYGASEYKRGVYVFGDPNDNWVRTRKIWNQHAYHITNVNSDGTLPMPEAASWIVPPGFNNYRQSNQGAGVFNAPDLQVSLEVSLSSCPTSLLLRAAVRNAGSLGVPAGVKVDFYRGTMPGGELLGSANTTAALLPGQVEILSFAAPASTQVGPQSFYVIVDGAELGDGELKECLEDNNDAAVSGVSCPTVI